jgi:CDP-diacylglycerol--serine O-phosphatidyltransferase
MAAAAWSARWANLWFSKMTLFGSLHPLVLMFAVSGSLMIGRLESPL